jgi:hypothetical protein
MRVKLGNPFLVKIARDDSRQVELALVFESSYLDLGPGELDLSRPDAEDVPTLGANPDSSGVFRRIRLRRTKENAETRNLGVGRGLGCTSRDTVTAPSTGVGRYKMGREEANREVKN